MNRVWFKRVIGVAAAAAWIVCTGAGFVKLLNHTYLPGAKGTAPVRTRTSLHKSLIVFAHPKCPCFRVTLENLEQLLHNAPRDIDVTFYFARPEGRTTEWVKEKYWERASRLPNATLLIDEGDVVAKKLGALTSGHVLLYTPRGQLSFSGGITQGRGHSGISAQAISLLERIQEKKSALIQSPVFGCPLF